MSKNNYIKVNGIVMLAANEGFYRERKMAIEQPTEEEISAAFPEYQIEAAEEDPEAPAEEAAIEQEEEEPKAPKRTYRRRS